MITMDYTDSRRSLPLPLWTTSAKSPSDLATARSPSYVVTSFTILAPNNESCSNPKNL